MNHTRIISAALTAALLLSLTACQQEQAPGDSSNAAPAAVAGQVQEVKADRSPSL